MNNAIALELTNLIGRVLKKLAWNFSLEIL
jgi:hypothetical protein